MSILNVLEVDLMCMNNQKVPKDWSSWKESLDELRCLWKREVRREKKEEGTEAIAQATSISLLNIPGKVCDIIVIDRVVHYTEGHLRDELYLNII